MYYNLGVFFLRLLHLYFLDDMKLEVAIYV